MFDEIFCNDMVDRCKLFLKKAVLPELVGKLYSRPLQEHTARQKHQISSCSNVQDQLIICICRAVYKKDVDNVTGCDNENCPYVWLHFNCAGIKHVPKSPWFCKSCRKHQNNNLMRLVTNYMLV